MNKAFADVFLMIGYFKSKTTANRLWLRIGVMVNRLLQNNYHV